MEVKLFVYDLTRGMARVMSRQMLGIQIDAVYHTAIVLDDIEYFFGAGIQSCRAGSTHHGQPMEVLSLGKTQLPKDVILEYLQSVKEIYSPESYDLFTHNCNNFTHDLAMFLLGRGIPDHITNLPQKVLDTPFGRMLRPQIDASMRSITQAPVLADETSESSKSTPASPGLRLLQLDSAKAVTYSRMPPLDKLVTKLGQASGKAPFADLIRFIRARGQSPRDAALPDMQSVCKAYQSVSTDLPLESVFAAVDLLRYAATDARVVGFLAEEPRQETTRVLAERMVKLGSACPHNLQLVTTQFLCNCFSSHLFSRALLTSEDSPLRSVVAVITSSLLDEAHTTSRVSAAWLAFNIADAAYRLSKEAGQAVLNEGLQVELGASILERLRSECNAEAVKALLMTLGRLLVMAEHDGELFDLTTALDAKSLLQGAKTEKELAEEILSIL